MLAKLCETNVPWGEKRSALVGVSALCYMVPFAVDVDVRRRFLWLLQTVVCFWSDYLDSGRWAPSHLVDKAVASSLTAYVLRLGLLNLGLLVVLVLAAPTFGCFFASARRRRRADFAGYAIFHSLWHLSSGLACAYTLLSCAVV